MTRLQILSNDDLDRLYGFPQLNDADRPFVFELDEIDKNYLSSVKDVATKVNYILHLGYFRISGYFFTFTLKSASEDVSFILKTYFPGAMLPKREVSNRQNYINRELLLQKYCMQDYSKTFESELVDHLEFLVKKHAVPRYLFDSALDYCNNNKIVRPPYSTLQRLISVTINDEKTRLNNKLYRIMGSKLRDDLNDLLKKNDIFYQLTLLKKDQKNFTTTEIRSTVEKNILLAGIYKASLKTIKELEISELNVAYYADLALRYSPYDLRNMKMSNLAKLYMLCYVNQRFLRINDHIVASFIHRVNGYISGAEVYQKEAIYKEAILDKENRNLAADILSLNIDAKVAEPQLRDKAFGFVPKNEFAAFVKKVRKPNLKPDYYRWEFYLQHSNAIKHNIRLTFNVIEFQTTSDEIRKAVIFLKEHFKSNKAFVDYKFEEIPTEFIPAALRCYVITKNTSKNDDEKSKNNKNNKAINQDAYEFMLYSQIEKSLSTGSISIKDSTNYRALDDELLHMEYWIIHQEQIKNDIKNQLPSMNITEILSGLEAQLNKRYIEVNSRISSGANDKINFQFDRKGTIAKWNIPYKKADDSANNPFYDRMNIAPLNQIIRFANHSTSFMKQFTHILPSHIKNHGKESSIAACIVAKATGIDIYRMKDISDIKEHELLSTYNNFIRYKTLTSASDILINKVAKLPIFEKYTLADYGVHASVDGQKIETKFHTIKARYGAKYFGFGQGVSAYTLFANCLPLSTKIIGANEHESHYLLDALKSNTSDVEIAAVSGDMHSINRVNFALLHMFGYRFMPRFTKLDEKASNNLVSFDDINNHKKNVIKPSRQVNKNLIIKEWDNILRILATLALKQNTQSNIVRKLSSYKLNDTMKALIELDKIIMSLYMLDYIDDEDMRKCVYRSLNRGESYHFLISSILKVSGRKLVGKTELELIINNECARLIAICIIFYNAYLLSSLYEHCRSKNMHEQCKQIIRLSPVAWQHISLVGKYEFLSNMELPNIESIIEQLVGNLGSMVVVAPKKKQKR